MNDSSFIAISRSSRRSLSRAVDSVVPLCRPTLVLTVQPGLGLGKAGMPLGCQGGRFPVCFEPPPLHGIPVGGDWMDLIEHYDV